MDCRVVVEAAVPVYDVETEDEAVRIAISKTGEMLNPDLNYVEINMGTRTGPDGEEMIPAFIAADEALVALELEMTVFNVERDEHASRIARKEIGQRLTNIPLKVLEVDEIVEEPDEADEDDEVDIEDDEVDIEDDVELGDDDVAVDDESEGELADQAAAGDGPEDEDEDDDLLPEFEELVDESRGSGT